MLFSDRSLLTMFHGIVLSGGALVLLVIAVYVLRTFAPAPGGVVAERHGRAFAQLTTAAAVLLWLAVIGGTYLVFPIYRVTPPEGVTALADYPRAFLLANPDTAWLHAFAMEIKEHVPFVAAMLVTATAVLARRHRLGVWTDSGLRTMASTLLAVSLILVVVVAVLGMFVNKVAPVW